LLTYQPENQIRKASSDRMQKKNAEAGLRCVGQHTTFAPRLRNATAESNQKWIGSSVG
jgi:hypothetical protein